MDRLYTRTAKRKKAASAGRSQSRACGMDPTYHQTTYPLSSRAPSSYVSLPFLPVPFPPPSPYYRNSKLNPSFPFPFSPSLRPPFAAARSSLPEPQSYALRLEQTERGGRTGCAQDGEGDCTHPCAWRNVNGGVPAALSGAPRRAVPPCPLSSLPRPHSSCSSPHPTPKSDSAHLPLQLPRYLHQCSTRSKAGGRAAGERAAVYVDGSERSLGSVR